jgi:hypothetical protein
MPRTLRDNVFFEGRWYLRGASVVEVGEVVSRIGDHVWVGEDEDASYGRGGDLTPAEPVVNAGAEEPVAGPEGDGSSPASSDSPKPPPQAGPGSSGEVWRDYAKAVGVEVPQDAKRDDVIDLVKAAGQPV